MMATAISFLVVCFIFNSVFGADWEYSGDHGPGHWASLYDACGANAQSPIDLPESSTMEYDSNLKPFTLIGFNNQSNILQLINNGHTAQLDILGDVSVEGGGLSQTHKSAQLHFHWGNLSSQGSEHTHRGKMYPLEMHIVNYNSKYSDIKAAADKPDGLAVLGFWFMVTAEDNRNFAPLLNHLINVQYKDEEDEVTDVVLAKLVLPTLDRYYRYKGSLTTPPCYESVTWTVFEEPISISENQLNLFRALNELTKTAGTNHKLANNYRPIQKINNRMITRSFWLDTDGASSLCASYLVTVGLAYLLHFL